MAILISGTNGNHFFIKVVHHIKNYIKDISSKNDKEALRNNCLYLAKYLIDHSTPPPYYITQKELWKNVLYEWLSPDYKKLDELGGCPVIMDKKHLEILELKYDIDDFCKKRNSYLNDLKQLNQKNSYDSTYSQKCNEYNIWIENRDIYFRTKQNLIESCYKINEKQQGKKNICNIMDPNTFNKQSVCRSFHLVTSEKSPSKKENKDSLLGENTHNSEFTSQVQSKKAIQETETQPNSQIQSQLQTNPEKISQNEPHIQSQTTLTPEYTPKENKFGYNGAQFTHVEVLQDSKCLVPSDSECSPESVVSTKSDISRETHDFQIVSPSSGKTNNDTQFPAVITPSKIPGRSKKKRTRRQAKFLKILTSSYSCAKNEFVKHDKMEYTLYDDEEFTKKIKILQHNKNNNINASKQNKHRYKTIIEVHMQILEEYRNEEWEYIKGEFLEICLELLTKVEHKTYSYLTNDELIMGNTKSINQKGKQKILWNKWIEKHQNLADKLKKEHWFNNLKNDWKRELDNLKKREELKNDPDEIQNIPFSQREKDIWRQWILENCIIIKQYIKQHLFNYLTDELQIIPDEHDNEKIKDSLLLINIGELSNKENCQELYKYIKKKLLTKLCILVLMSVLEECKKEQDIENNESHLDNYIIKFKEKENSDSKKEFIENISDFNRNFLGNMENPDYTTDDSFRKEIENWIIGDNTNANSMEK
ncbi:STP1 protein [Plasmodium malariae]|uniref:STP1 protein n=1 Tax=Plasmodium malariae TaxID=5858 RepID=A0A1D3PB17_PLAMA|nr:STP1 protein [Plasmodium malariae]SCN12450.1 STP1 protein [Plasmodium malariae]